MTSSPGPTPATSSAMCNADVPVLVATTYRSFNPRYCASPSSKDLVTAPMPSHPTFNVSTTALMVSTPMYGWKTGMGGGVSATHAPQVAVGGGREHELRLQRAVHLEAVVGLEELVHGGLGIVALTPRPP